MVGSQIAYDPGDKPLSRLVELRRWFHQHPELSFQEVETAQKIVTELERLNIALVRQVLLDNPGYSRQLNAYAENQSARAVAENLERQLMEEKQQFSSAA